MCVSVSAGEKAQPPQVILGPADLILDNLLERANGKNLPGTVQMDGNASAIRMFKKTGRTFAPCAVQG